MKSGRGFLRWIDDPPPAALHFASLSFDWRRYPYEELARQSRQMAGGLVHAGVRGGDVIVIASSHGPEFVAAFFGTIVAGATPSVAAPPRAFENDAAYRAHFLHVCRTAAARFILTSAELVATLSAIPGLHAPVLAFNEIFDAGDQNVATRDRAELALLQYTAGSSGEVRAVRVPHGALETNVAAIQSWLNWTSEDTAAFWIPHYHDMGLIGGLLAPMASCCDVWLLTPEQFIHRPLEYLRCFGERSARLTALPSFGLDYMTRRIGSSELRGMDFSSVKGFIIGAELIDAATLTRFHTLLEPFGLRSGTLLPAYGLAEATLAVTGVRPGEEWTVEAGAGGGRPIVGCGAPIDRVEVSIIDHEGRANAEGETGEIVISGASVAAGYRGMPPSSSLTSFEGTSIHTGDAGFLLRGQLFPVGRLGDSVKIRGRTLFAEILEAELSGLGHAREHNAILLGTREGDPAVLWIAERMSASRDEALKLLSRLAEGSRVFLIEVGRGAIPRTSSGKPRRRAMWMDFIHHRISGKVTTYFSRED